jgi:hypothetical protein
LRASSGLRPCRAVACSSARLVVMAASVPAGDLHRPSQRALGAREGRNRCLGAGQGAIGGLGPFWLVDVAVRVWFMVMGSFRIWMMRMQACWCPPGRTR